jgi:hypothetical protein
MISANLVFLEYGMLLSEEKYQDFVYKREESQSLLLKSLAINSFSAGRLAKSEDNSLSFEICLSDMQSLLQSFQ